MDEKPEISIVIPLYNEEKNITPLYNELAPALKELCNYYEILFVDDGSRDKSFDIIRQLSAQDSGVRGISLSRNFGHQVALMAGLEHSTGNVVITMDADLQHPPQFIREMYKAWQDGYDIVNTRREDIKNLGFIKRVTSKLFYMLINLLSDVRIESASADFRLLSRKVVDSFTSIRERDRFTRGLISWMGYKQTIIDYMQPERFAGKSKYSLKKMLRFGIDGITSFSSKPLRLSFYCGLFILLCGIAYTIYAVVQYFLGVTAPGWASILISVLIIGGFQLLSLGIIGEYIARIFNESKARPLYFVKDATFI
ncbi:MAG: glycosyltransferase family 2 protein [Bacteroidetes bacterium]|nr:glycosyltransferase family 2 protein [Bacteroidota bacterium]